MSNQAGPRVAVSTAVRPSLMVRLRTWITGAAFFGAAFVWAMPAAENSFNDKTWWVLRWVVEQSKVIGAQIKPFVVALLCAAVVSWIISFLANRQRRRITEQVCRLLRIHPQGTYARIIAGRKAPFRANVRIPAGHSFDQEQLDEAAELISRSWNYVYDIRHDELNDRLFLVRHFRKGLSTLYDEPSNDEPEAVYESEAHQRIEEVKDKFPIKVKKIKPTSERNSSGEPMSYDIIYETVASSAMENWQTRVSSAIVGLVGRAPDGHEWKATWFPDEDRVRLDAIELPPEPKPLSTYIAHPVIKDYESFLGTDRFALPYATSKITGKPLYWDIDAKSNTPHGLITGPTGGGKTTAAGTLISEGALRGMPWLLFDPKRFELMHFAHHPGVIGVATDVHSCIEGIRMLWKEKEEREKYRETRPWVENKDMPLFGVVIDEFFLLSFLLQQEMKKDDDIKELDPLGMLNVMVVVIRAIGGRLNFLLQRPDAKVWGGGNARMNLGMRLAMSRQDGDGDQMMFDRTGVTSGLDVSIPGRGIGTNAQGDPEECQVWYTPNLNPHPRVREKLSGADQLLVNQLTPAEPPSKNLWTPESEWSFLRPKFEIPSTERAEEPKAIERPSAPTGELEIADLDTAVEARHLIPDMRIAVTVDGTLVPATITDVTEDGDRIEIEYQADGEKGKADIAYGRREMVPVIDVD